MTSYFDKSSELVDEFDSKLRRTSKRWKDCEISSYFYGDELYLSVKLVPFTNNKGQFSGNLDALDFMKDVSRKTGKEWTFQLRDDEEDLDMDDQVFIEAFCSPNAVHSSLKKDYDEIQKFIEIIETCL